MKYRYNTSSTLFQTNTVLYSFIFMLTRVRKCRHHLRARSLQSNDSYSRVLQSTILHVLKMFVKYLLPKILTIYNLLNVHTFLQLPINIGLIFSFFFCCEEVLTNIVTYTYVQQQTVMKSFFLSFFLVCFQTHVPLLS